MSVKFSQIKFQSSQKKRKQNYKKKNTFVYSKRSEELNFDQMYESLQQDVAKIVDQKRTKIMTMDPTRSKDLFNKTQTKLVNFLKSKPTQYRLFTPSNVGKKSILNINMKIDNNRQPFQQIFDFNKLEKILKSYERPIKQKPIINGGLARQTVKLIDQKMLEKPLTHRKNMSTSELNRQSRNYISWTSQRKRRSQKCMFN